MVYDLYGEETSPRNHYPDAMLDLKVQHRFAIYFTSEPFSSVKNYTFYQDSSCNLFSTQTLALNLHHDSDHRVTEFIIIEMTMVSESMSRYKLAPSHGEFSLQAAIYQIT